MDSCFEIGGSCAEQLDQPSLNWWHSYVRAMRAQIAGNTEEAERLATEALERGTASGQPDAARFFGAQLMVVSLQRGTMEALVPLIEQMAADTPEIAGLTAAALALAHVEADRFVDARHLLEEFAAADFDLPLDPVWFSGMLAYAQAAIGCGDPKYAGPLFDRLAPWADQFSTTGITADGPVSHCLGGLATVLVRYDEADAYFTQAAAFNHRANARFFAAATNLSWATMRAERRAPGDIEKARDLLSKARAAAVTHGYANVERRAAAALQHLD
jgi:tetratricopeptide (TPR) repeat protein